jgi:hypothetical protein
MRALDPVRFLLADGNVSAAKTVLVVQTGAPDLLIKAVDVVRTTLPAASITVLLQRNMADKVPARLGIEYLENLGSKRALTQRLRDRRFDVAFVLYVNQPGFWKLKLLPFFIGARHVLAINEHMGWFPLSLRHAGALARHMSWRMSRHEGEGASMALAERLVRAVAKPAVIAWLIAYEKLASLRANTSWKRENRIPPGRA